MHVNQCEFFKVLHVLFFELPVQAGTTWLLEFVGSTDTSQTYVPKARLFPIGKHLAWSWFQAGGGNPLERNLEGEEPVQNSSTRLSTHETVPFTVYTFAFRYSTRFQITDVVLRLYLQALSLESSTTHGSKFPKHEVV